MGKFKAKEVKDLLDYIKENRKKTKNRFEEIKLAKSETEKIMKVEEFIICPKHKPAERTAIYDPENNDLITDEQEILATTLKHSVEVLTKNKFQTMDLQSVIDKNTLHESVMTLKE